MKYGLITNYWAAIFNKKSGESYSTIIGYFLPEFITSFVIFALPFWIDSYFISFLKSTPAYATLGTTNNTLHLLFKIAEAFSIGAVVLVGNYNGKAAYKTAGNVFKNLFWITVFFGAIFAIILYFASYIILAWLDASPEIITLGIPFWRLRAIGVFFTFIYLAFIGFLRGIKNTKTPMYIFLIGAFVFIFFDYGLIFGVFGLPHMGFNGSAWASVLQSIIMVIAAAIFVLANKTYRAYSIHLFTGFNKAYIKELFFIIWPITIDKATLAFAYIWLSKMLNSMGTCTTASFCAIKDLERFAFLPAIALAQIITFLVSNDLGIHNWTGIKTNIKKVLFLGSIMVFSILATFSFFSGSLMQIFDKSGDFTQMTIRIFPILSILVFFDLVQLILSGALRGAGDVKIVMWTRLAVCIGYFFPVSYLLKGLPIADRGVKFLLIYGSFYIGNGLMSLVYINRLRGPKWKNQEI
jgi:multidrug resistance protein, MATE family